MTIQIRQAATADDQAICSLTQAAFADVSHSTHTEHCIVEALREADALTVSLVAECEGRIVGHIAVSPVTISDGTEAWYGLGPVSVQPEEQGKGIGSKMMRAALDALILEGAKGCVLLGEPAFYGRFGFQQQAELILPGAPVEYFQALAFDAPMPTGQVTYHEAFSAQ